MKVLFDTSVLVAGIVQVHPAHQRALPWMQRAKAGGFKFIVASHTLAELYAVLTTLPVRPRISPSTAWRLVQTNVGTSASLVPLSSADYRRTLREMAERGRSGGVVYDALIVSVARRMAVDRLLTLNAKDFLRIWPEGTEVITSP
jgi:predicted nucleic acid-binding protein